MAKVYLKELEFPLTEILVAVGKSVVSRRRSLLTTALADLLPSCAKTILILYVKSHKYM